MLHLELASVRAVQSLMERDAERARAAAARARAVAEEYYIRSDEVAKIITIYGITWLTGEYLRVTRTALALSRAARDIEDELDYRYPRRPSYL